jgi:hypothetical protein
LKKPFTYSEAQKAPILLSSAKKEKAYTSEAVAEQKKKQSKDKKKSRSLHVVIMFHYPQDYLPTS